MRKRSRSSVGKVCVRLLLLILLVRSLSVSPKSQSKGVRVAVVVYGLPRSLSWTVESIHRSVLRPLRAVGFEVNVYAHAYHHVNLYTNQRSQERNVRVNNSEWLLLGADEITIDIVDVIRDKLSPLRRRLEAGGDSWGDRFQSLDRSLLALYSMKQATVLAQTSSKVSKYAVLLRADLHYVDDIDVNALTSPNTLTIPAWQWWGGYNDRFAFGKTQAIFALGSRLDYVEMFRSATDSAYNSETFLKWFIINRLRHNNITLWCTTQRAIRVRADGRYQSESFVTSGEALHECKNSAALVT